MKAEDGGLSRVAQKHGNVHDSVSADLGLTGRSSKEPSAVASAPARLRHCISAHLASHSIPHPPTSLTGRIHQSP